MKKGRLEAFSDGVIAIIITIMVLELKVPHQDSFEALKPLLPVFFSYVLSFIYVGIYWNNHHHLMHPVTTVTGGILWANMHLLFWLSLIPFVTAWMGENHFSTIPVACYGFVLLMNAVAYSILARLLIKRNPALANALGSDLKGKISLIIYLVAMILSFVNAAIGFSLYIVVAGIWIIPDKRIEKKISSQDNSSPN